MNAKANNTANIIREPDFNAISLDGGKHWRYFVRDTRTDSVYVLEQEGHPEGEGEITGYAMPSFFHRSMTEESLVNADLDHQKFGKIEWKYRADMGFLATVKPSDWPVGQVSQEVS